MRDRDLDGLSSDEALELSVERDLGSGGGRAGDERKKKSGRGQLGFGRVVEKERGRERNEQDLDLLHRSSSSLGLDGESLEDGLGGKESEETSQLSLSESKSRGKKTHLLSSPSTSERRLRRGLLRAVRDLGGRVVP